MNAVESSDEKVVLCQICESLKSDGFHFQVVSCRSCAIFFRRTKDPSGLQCRQKTRDCDVSKGNCRHCRYKKCLAKGMTLKGMRQRKTTKPCSKLPNVTALLAKNRWAAKDQSINVPDPMDALVRDFPALSFAGHKVNLNMDVLISQICDVLKNNSSRHVQTSPLQALLHSYGEMFPVVSQETLQMADGVYNENVYKFFAHHTIQIARWVMNIPEFAALRFEDKRKIYMNFWAYAYAIERCDYIVRVLGKDSSLNLYFRTKSNAAQIWKVVTEGPKINGLKTNTFNQEHYRFHLDSFQIPARKARLSTFESVFMCFYKLWCSKKIPDLAPETYKLANGLLNEASAELHEYYTKTLKRKNYVSKVQKLFELLDGLDQSLLKKNQMYRLQKTFQVFESEFYESELWSAWAHL